LAYFSKFQGLEPVLDPLRNIDFVGFLELVGENFKFEKNVPEPVPGNPKF
jgi:hypothetical protein